MVSDFPEPFRIFLKLNDHHNKRFFFRDQLPTSSASSPSLIRSIAISDPIIRRSILEDMYEDVKWLIDDQFITNLRRKSPVTLDLLKQVCLSSLSCFYRVIMYSTKSTSLPVKIFSTALPDPLMDLAS